MPDGRHYVVFHDARLRLREDGFDHLVENLRGALYPGDFFGAFDRAGFLEQFRGIFKLRLGKVFSHFFDHAVHDGPFRRAKQTAQTADADACLSKPSSLIRSITGSPQDRRDGADIRYQSWAMLHHSTSLPPRTKAVTSPDSGKTTATSV